MTEVEEKLNLVVVKRNGKKVDFDATKIALAIKKGFDSVNEQDEETGKYTYDDKDIKKVHDDVIKTIEKKYTDKIKIEEIQDLIEQSLEKKGYMLYLKDGEEISEFLALIGANSSVIKFEEIRLFKE